MADGPAAAAAATLAAAVPPGGARLVTIDGPSGAGKSTLADALAARLRPRRTVAVVRLEDLYDGWRGLDEALTERLAAIVAAVTAGRPLRYPVYDWRAGRFAGERVSGPAQVTILEGVGAGQPVTTPAADLRVWCEADPATCARRVRARDGSRPAAAWRAWAAAEPGHFAWSRARDHADVIVADGVVSTPGRTRPRPPRA